MALLPIIKRFKQKGSNKISLEKMSGSAKVILLSQVPLPYSKIGSWTTLYRNYLENDHKIDYIVCPKPQNIFKGIKYSFVNFSFFNKLRKKFFKQKNLDYLQALNKLITPNEQYIIQIIDNYGMIKPLVDYLSSKGIINQCYIQFFYHGYLPYNQQDSERDFYGIIDEIILLTNDSYNVHKKHLNVIKSYFSILPNGIDTKKFRKVSVSEKIELKQQLGFEEKKVFVWCSQDRPKKGLNLILDVWQQVYTQNKNCILVVIGTLPREQMNGVLFLGKISNDELAKYYQAADCYLFPTLCQEGFGLSLVEALHCGAYCIASALGGVPEVLQYGKFGKLIENPNFVYEWKDAINDFLDRKIETPELPSQLYSMESWNNEMNEIIINAKNRLENNRL